MGLERREVSGQHAGHLLQQGWRGGGRHRLCQVARLESIGLQQPRLAGGQPLALETLEDGTLARAALPEPVAPGEAVEIELEFHAQLPRVFARTGYAGDFLMVGQWFPKLGVWQDGAWNAYPFHANAEFYADFGTYDVAITLPAGHVTGATGLPVEQADNGDGTQTVAYHAEGVIDFAWTASPDFEQESRSVDGVEVIYLYLPEHARTVDRVLDATEAALTHYGQWYGTCPYPRLTVVDVPDDLPGQFDQVHVTNYEQKSLRVKELVPHARIWAPTPDRRLNARL